MKDLGTSLFTVFILKLKSIGYSQVIIKKATQVISRKHQETRSISINTYLFPHAGLLFTRSFTTRPVCLCPLFGIMPMFASPDYLSYGHDGKGNNIKSSVQKANHEKFRALGIETLIIKSDSINTPFL